MRHRHLAEGLNAAGGIVGTQARVDSLDRNMVPPMAVNYVIGAEHELPWRLVAGASYSGSESYDGLNGSDINRYAGDSVVTPATSTTPASEAVNRLNPNFGPITYVTNANYANYNAMILTLRGRVGATAADFPVPAPGTEGNEPRNIYRNPGMLQIDASLLKNTHLPHLGDQGNLQFRFDFINLFNHVNLGPVDPNIADSTFGRSTTALSGRALQLGVRFAF
jgi:hypothetical protein